MESNLKKDVVQFFSGNFCSTHNNTLNDELCNTRVCALKKHLIPVKRWRYFVWPVTDLRNANNKWVGQHDQFINLVPFESKFKHDIFFVFFESLNFFAHI